MTIRWFVEVSPLDGSAHGERYCVEALQWQQALQQARKLRGDRAPLARFAMEVLEVGFRATDPTGRLRYTVSKAPVTAALTAPPPSRGAPGRLGANGAGSPSTPPRATANGSTASARVPSSPVATAAAVANPTTEGLELEELSNPALVPLPPPLETNFEDALPTLPHASEPPRPPASLPSPRPSEGPRPPARTSQIPLPRSGAPRTRIPTPTGMPRPRGALGADAGDTGADVSGGSLPPKAVHAAPSAPPRLEPTRSESPREEPAPSLPGVTMLSQRREDPTEAVPILYREYAMAYDGSPSPRDLERLARALWEQVRAAVAPRPPGKFVQIALFDHRFADKPERAPAVVLSWKDWRGDPVIRVRPTRSAPMASTAPAPITSPPVAPATATPLTVPKAPPLTTATATPLTVPTAPPLAAATATPLTVPKAPPLAAFAPAPVPPAPAAPPENVTVPFAAPVAPPLAPVAPPPDVPSPFAAPTPIPPARDGARSPSLTPIPVAPPLASFPEPPAAPAEAAAGSEPRAPLPPSNRRGSAPRSSGNAVRRRGSSEDLISELFEEMHQLHFMPDLVAGADYVLTCVLFMLPCEGALIHVFDINSRQFVVLRAAGPTFRDALLLRTPDTHPLFREALRQTSGALRFENTEGDERFAEERYQRLGVQVKSAMIGAVQHGGRYLGMIELLNPVGGQPYRESEMNALDYICEQFADFVASRPLVLDEDAVLPKA